ncbi:Protein of unknown function [Mycolicibacterium rutilum]|uniref:DUF732 domain-containing protein n=1 Tax=Mycolicibacterium rutilum TaxID=370526 RepID=A0A1H6KWM5_MYCRU|nr:DUF732 domain-containing protein [Mycolicibacterium rutilum]SEH76126.1 Protein of unknown function [Mycolicibacterium rutilum]
MKKLFAAATAALALAIGTAVPAHADEESYLTDLANNDFEGDVDVALEMGYQICTDVQHGVPQETTVQAIYENTGEGVAIADAQYIYEAAVIHLC